MYPHNPHAATLRNRTPFKGTIAYMGGVPALLSEWVWSWSQMLVFNGEHFGPGTIHYDRAQSSFHATSRNQLASRMKGDWLLQLDTDHQFAPDLCSRLVATFEEHNLDVLCGFYQQRTWPHCPVLYKFIPDEDHPDSKEVVTQHVVGWAEDWPVIEVDSAGGGCLLVRRRVFDRIRKELGEEPFDIRHPWSEDHSFFHRCRQIGLRSFCDTRVDCHHLVTRPVMKKDFNGGALGGDKRQHQYEVPVG